MSRRKRKKRSGCLRAVLAMLITAAGICIGVIGIGIWGLKNESVKEELSDVLPEGLSEKIMGEEVPYQTAAQEDNLVLGKYYFGQLSEEEQAVYKEILQGVRDHVEEIYVHSENAEETNALFQKVLKDFPEIFWCGGASKTTAYNGSQNYTVLEPVYTYEEEECARRKAEIEAAAEECLAGISGEASDYEKIQYVYEYIVNMVEYDMEASDNQNIYSVFVGKRSVCAGYAKAAQYLLERLGLFCTYVTGTAGEERQPHAWNLVQCGGDYYHLDVTWGDPVFQSQEEKVTNQNYISYDYMCCSDAEIFRTHTLDADAGLPDCTKMDCNYYVVNGMYYTDYDSETAMEAINQVIYAGENPVVFKYSDAALYQEAHQDIFDNLIPDAAQNIARRYGLSEVKYSYIDDERFNKIVIYWQYS